MAKSPDERYGSVEAMLADLRRFLAQEPVCANPPSAFRRFRLFAGRNPLAATAIAASAVFLAAFFTALSIAYVRTSRALEETHREAAQAAQSLANALTKIERGETDPRDAELKRALEIAEALASRFPDDEKIHTAIETLRAAREAHAKLPKRRLHPPRRIVP